MLRQTFRPLTNGDATILLIGPTRFGADRLTRKANHFAVGILAPQVILKLQQFTITSDSSGTGSGTLNYTVAPNNSTNIRSGALTIAGESFSITQAGTLALWLAIPVQLSNGAMQITLTGEAGRTYVIEASPDVSNWIPIHTNVANDGAFQFNDTAATNSNNRFYRGRLQ